MFIGVISLYIITQQSQLSARVESLVVWNLHLALGPPV